MISIRRLKTSNNTATLPKTAKKAAFLEKMNKSFAFKQPLFHLSNKIDYGLFLLIELSKNGNNEPLSLKTIAQKHQMSFFFLQKVANDLRKSELIASTRGKNGGYILKKQAEKMTLKEILEALEGPIAIMHCLAHGPEGQTCVREGWCGMKKGLHYVNEVIVKAFTQTTLHHLLHPTWQP